MILLNINLHFKPYIFQGWIPLYSILGISLAALCKFYYYTVSSVHHMLLRVKNISDTDHMITLEHIVHSLLLSLHLHKNYSCWWCNLSWKFFLFLLCLCLATVAAGIAFSNCPFCSFIYLSVTKLVNMIFRKWINDFDANWHKCFTEFGHKTTNCGHREVKGQGQTRPEVDLMDVEASFLTPLGWVAFLVLNCTHYACLSITYWY